MNYYNPNFYQGYNYGNSQYFPQQSQYQVQPQQVQQQPQMPTINGKIVDSEDLVKVAEIPMGEYGVFPKADLSEIYIKTWNQNGTTSIIKYEKAETPVKEEKDETAAHNELITQIEMLNKKIDTLLNNTPTKPIVKEGMKNEF